MKAKTTLVYLIGVGLNRAGLYLSGVAQLGLIGLSLIGLTLSPAAQADHDVFEQVFNKHQFVMLLIDPATGQIVQANPAASRFYGYSVSSLEQMKIQQINALSPEAVAEERALASKENRNYFIFRHKAASGEVYTVEVSSVPMNYDGKTLLFSIIRDITALRETEDAFWHYQNNLEKMVEEQIAQLKSSEYSWRVLLSTIILLLVFGAAGLIVMLQKSKIMRRAMTHEKQRLDEVIWSTNVGTWEKHIPTGRVIINERWAEMLGYTLQEVTPLNHTSRQEFIHPDDLEISDERLREHYRGKTDSYSCEMRLRHKQGNWVWVQDHGKVVERDAQGKPLRMVGTHQDISEQKKASEQLKHLAHFDLLTDLPNRTLFYDRFHQAILVARRNNSLLAMLFVDLDGFKSVNDNYGHSSGDKVLQVIAQRLKDALRQSDIVGRMGGDEFSVLLQNLHKKEDALQLAAKMIEQIKQPIPLDNNQSATLSGSIGIAFYPEHAMEAENLIQLADDAMYFAKKSGKGRYSVSGTSVCHQSWHPGQ